MNPKAARLARLVTIRKLNEEISRRDLQLALASVAEVEAGLARQGAALADARQAGLSALATGDRFEWLMADAQSEAAGWNRERLRVILEERARAVGPAMGKFVESRREHEQVKQLVEDAQRAAGRDEDRRAQAAADDWFLSRRARSEE